MEAFLEHFDNPLNWAIWVIAWLAMAYLFNVAWEHFKKHVRKMQIENAQAMRCRVIDTPIQAKDQEIAEHVSYTDYVVREYVPYKFVKGNKTLKTIGVNCPGCKRVLLPTLDVGTRIICPHCKTWVARSFDKENELLVWK